MMRGSRITECVFDQPDCYEISFTDTIDGEPIKRWAWVCPYRPLELTFQDDFGPPVPAPSDIAEAISRAWSAMETRFRTSHRIGACRILARVGSATATRFTALTPEAFDAFKITDWRSGTAETARGELIYAIHAAPPARPEHESTAMILRRRFETSPMKRMVGRWFYAHHRQPLNGEIVPAEIITRIKAATVGTSAVGRLDEKTIRGAYRLFRDLIACDPSFTR
ncbi:MAG: hypothetical protein ACRECV_15900 [Xanthobacteraceae bacterium]